MLLSFISSIRAIEYQNTDESKMSRIKSLVDYRVELVLYLKELAFTHDFSDKIKELHISKLW